MSRPVRHLRAGALVCVLAFLGAPASASACPGADEVPGAESSAGARAAVVCLLNRERTSRGLRKLKSSSRLAKAARAHASDMVDRGYFAHDDPEGQGMLDRLRAVRYVTRTVRWAVGENLAWGTGRLSTPRAAVRMWMESPPHRRNVLSPRFSEVGVAMVPGAPRPGVAKGRSAATWVSEYGTRARPKRR